MPRFTKRHAIAQLLVCASGCCCGRTDKGKPAVPVEFLKREWRSRRLNPRVQLTITECLGPCDQLNVVGILSEQAPIWLGGLIEPWHFEALLSWAASCHAAGVALPLPDALATHVVARFPAAPLDRPEGAATPPIPELVP
jgi:hypothetical protein